MLDFSYIQEQLGTFSLYQAEEVSRRKAQLDAVKALMRELALTGEQLEFEKSKEAGKKDELVAVPLEHIALRKSANPRPPFITVAATDGSQIYPDHHIDPQCYLLNISQIVFHYGTLKPAEMTTFQSLRYREQDRKDFEGLTTDTTEEMVSILRDQLEMERLLEISKNAQQPDMPLVAIADGTLVRWMLKALNNKQLEDAFVKRYADVLREFRKAYMPFCSYQSQPNHREVVKLLETRVSMPLDTLRDRQVFAHFLETGERSALFATTSHIMKDYAEEDRICYFYVKVGGLRGSAEEVARVEVPRWLADDPHLLDIIHAVVLDQAQKGDGYPVILVEAHERAVIRAHEKEIFYRLLNRQLRENGMGNITYSRKQLSKRRPMV